MKRTKVIKKQFSSCQGPRMECRLRRGAKEFWGETEIFYDSGDSYTTITHSSKVINLQLKSMNFTIHKRYLSDADF